MRHQDKKSYHNITHIIDYVHSKITLNNNLQLYAIIN